MTDQPIEHLPTCRPEDMSPPDDEGVRDCGGCGLFEYPEQGSWSQSNPGARKLRETPGQLIAVHLTPDQFMLVGGAVSAQLRHYQYALDHAKTDDAIDRNASLCVRLKGTLDAVHAAEQITSS